MCIKRVFRFSSRSPWGMKIPKKIGRSNAKISMCGGDAAILLYTRNILTNTIAYFRFSLETHVCTVEQISDLGTPIKHRKFRARIPL